MSGSGPTSPDVQNRLQPIPEEPEVDVIDTPGIIIVNSHQFSVRDNLFLALRNLRSSTHRLALWVDAICINQNDIEERNRHVTLMSFICRRAFMVVAWLGPRVYEGVPALDSRMMRAGWINGSSRSLAECLEGCRKLVPQGPNKVDGVSTSYWTQAWVLQQVCLAERLVFAYGSGLWPYEDPKKRLSWRDQNIEPSEHLLEERARILNVRQMRYGNGMTLEILLQLFSHATCSDTRDRIYGILGLAQGVIPYTIDPADPQNQPLSNPEGMLKVSITIRNPTLGAPKTAEPTWLGNSEFLALRGQMQCLNIVKASRIVQKALGRKDEQQDSMITAIGYLGGEILGFGPDNPQSYRSQEEWQYYLESGGYYTEDRTKTLRETNAQYMSKICGRRLSRIQSIINPRVTAWHWEDPRTQSLDPDYDYDAEYKKIWEGADDQLAQPKFCVCTGNQVALVPSTAQPGDVIIRFCESCTAIVMRRYKDGGPFMLIGRADVANPVEREPPKTKPKNGETVLPGPQAHFLAGFKGDLCRQYRGKSRAPGAVHVDLDFDTLQQITAPMHWAKRELHT
ncbi:heterokaryon incompatibility protein-domain-containing protein [Hypoxylon sp. FL1857]|nr:heterokaryon incompatibility protein-domain-containing protein [Hypoxylon sp. FL1857]